MIKKTLSAIVALTLLSIIAILYAGDSLIPAASPAQAQQSVDSDDLATFVALMQYIRSDTTPADVKAANLPLLATLDAALSDLYITGFITPYTGETAEQVKARLQSIPEKDRFTAVMVESYRLTSNPLLLDIIHQLLPLYYVEFFTTTDLSDASDFLKKAEIVSLADDFDSTDYTIPAPTAPRMPGGTSPSTQTAGDVDSDDLATFVALMQYIRSDPTPADVKAANLPLLAALDAALSDLYITGFITPYTGETPEQVKARLQSIPEESRFTAVMVESYRLTSNPLLLDIIHQLLPLYYVEFFTTAEDPAEFLKRDEIETLAAEFDPTDYAIPAPTATQTPTTTPSPTPTTTDDRATLVALYNATDGPNWSTSTNWLSNKPIGEWYGVTTDDSGRVTGLSLLENGLSGQIPTELGSLSNLEELWLLGNSLSGPIPTQLGNLSNLEELWLADNSLSGPIPTQLGNLSNLEVLLLSVNQLSGPIPTQLGNLSNLTLLRLEDNRLSGQIPTQLGNLSNLEVLYLDSNQLSGPIPAQLGNLSNLTFLTLDNNQLSGRVPTWLGSLSKLEFLNLGYNDLTGTIPAELGNLSNLTRLSLSGNLLTGTIPTQLGNLSNLTWLGLGGGSNQLSGQIPTWLGNLSKLEFLDLTGNQLTGTIPTQLGNLSNLTWLHLSGNELSGGIPSELGNLSNLTYLTLNDNQLTGPIPAEFGNLANLEVLDISGNQLTGCIPSSLRGVEDDENSNLGGLPFCDSVDDDHANSIEAATAATIGEAIQATLDYEGDVDFFIFEAEEGEVYQVEVGLGALSYSFLSLYASDGSRLNGKDIYADTPAPSVAREAPSSGAYYVSVESYDIGNYTLTVTVLDIDDDHANYHIEDPLKAGSTLVHEYAVLPVGGEPVEATLDYEGDVDFFIFEAEEGENYQIDLVSGTLSAYWVTLYDSSGRLAFAQSQSSILWQSPTTGEYFVEVGGYGTGTYTLAVAVSDIADDRTALGVLYNATNGPNWTNNTNWLSDKPLGEWHGVTTDDDGRVTELELESNRLQGELPPELGNLANLTKLNLSVNGLTGTIPTTLGDLSDLRYLDLSDNRLSGEIPAALGNLSDLRSLTLSENQLTGEIPPELGDLYYLKALWLSDNQLTGEIPPELGNIYHLQFLYLDQNRLTGEIPPELGNLTNLLFLWLSDNRLTGCVPRTLTDLPNLSIWTGVFGLPDCN